ELHVYDIAPEKGASLVNSGANLTRSPSEAARDVEILFTCLPGPHEVEAAALQENGFAETLKSGSTWFDLTTNSPEVVRRLHRKLGVRGVSVLDAPISGGPKGAACRRLALWVGGEIAIFNRYLSLLKTIGDEPLHVGPIGAGCIAKLVHNSASFTIQIALAEAFSLGVKAGLDPLVLFKALRSGTTGRRRTFDRLAEQFLPGNYDPPSFALRLAVKDMNLALELAQSFGFSMPIAELAMEHFSEALHRGWGERDARIAMTLPEERAGISLHVSPQLLKITNEVNERTDLTHPRLSTTSTE
ncbi:MAG: NAD(P)-dependent oxidoreductase, partial [Ktedonobacteraceae bacterium]